MPLQDTDPTPSFGGFGFRSGTLTCLPVQFSGSTSMKFDACTGTYRNSCTSTYSNPNVSTHIDAYTATCVPASRGERRNDDARILRWTSNGRPPNGQGALAVDAGTAVAKAEDLDDFDGQGCAARLADG